MDYNKIKNLLEKYWEGETSLQEEQLLKRYFNGNNVASDLECYRSLFVYFKQEKGKTSGASFDHIAKERKTIVRAFWINRLSIAASVLLIVVAGLFYYNNTMISNDSLAEDGTIQKDTYDDPKAAYKEAKAALLLISKSLNKGIKKTKEGVRKVRD